MNWETMLNEALWINIAIVAGATFPESVTSPTKKWQFPIYNKHLAQICCSPCG